MSARAMLGAGFVAAAVACDFGAREDDPGGPIFLAGGSGGHGGAGGSAAQGGSGVLPPDSPTSLAIGGASPNAPVGSVTLTAVATYPQGQQLDVSLQAGWSSLDEQQLRFQPLSNAADRLGPKRVTVRAQFMSVDATFTFHALCEERAEISLGGWPDVGNMNGTFAAGPPGAYVLVADPTPPGAERILRIDEAGKVDPHVTGLFPVGGMAVDGDRGWLYWTETDDSRQGYSLRRISIGGGTPETLFANPPALGGGARGVAVDAAGAVYVAAGDCASCLRRWEQSSGVADVPLGSPFAPMQMAADLTHLYGIDFNPDPKLARVALGGGDLEPIAASGAPIALLLTIDWAYAVTGSSDLWRWPKANLSDAEKVATQLRYTTGIGADEAAVFYPRNADGSGPAAIWAAPIAAAGAPVEPYKLADCADLGEGIEPHAVTASGPWVYATLKVMDGTARLVRIPK